jgi:hypothetical protein
MFARVSTAPGGDDESVGGKQTIETDRAHGGCCME